MTAKPARSEHRSRLGGRLQSAKSSGIAVILNEGGENHAGMGILIDRRHIVTCAHVINVALGEADTSQRQPGDDKKVRVRFPLSDQETSMSAEIARWHPPGMDRLSDIALLTLEADAPESAGIAILADITGVSLEADRLSVFGLGRERWIGNHVDATLMGSSTDAWIQIDAVNKTGAFVEQGFSGAAVWDATHQAVVGMIVAKLVSETEKIAYMIRADDLAAMVSELHIERRNLPSSFPAAWTILAATMFTFVGSHLAVQRGVDSFQALTLSGANTQLAAFWGMHVWVLLMPVLMSLLLSFSNGFRQHPWWQSVPLFGQLSGVPRPTSRRLSALAAILFFVVLPFAAQANFISHFLEGKVYVDPTDFACNADQLIGRGMSCNTEEDTTLCGFADPVRISLVRTCDGSIGPYRDTAYRYGDAPTRKHWVTYYPILQPLMIYAATAIAFALAVMSLCNIFGIRALQKWVPRLRAEKPRLASRQ